MKLLEENTGVNLHDLGFSNGFLEMTPKAYTHTHKKKERKKIDTLDFFKIKKFLCFRRHHQ